MEGQRCYDNMQGWHRTQALARKMQCSPGAKRQFLSPMNGKTGNFIYTNTEASAKASQRKIKNRKTEVEQTETK